MNGLDASYFQAKLRIIVRDAVYFTPQEMARELVRLAKVADECEAIKEASVTPPVTPKHIEEIKDILLWPVTEDDARTARDMLQSLHFDLSMNEDCAPTPAPDTGELAKLREALASGYCGGMMTSDAADEATIHLHYATRVQGEAAFKAMSLAPIAPGKEST